MALLSRVGNNDPPPIRLALILTQPRTQRPTSFTRYNKVFPPSSYLLFFVQMPRAVRYSFHIMIDIAGHITITTACIHQLPAPPAQTSQVAVNVSMGEVHGYGLEMPPKLRNGRHPESVPITHRSNGPPDTRYRSGPCIRKSSTKSWPALRSLQRKRSLPKRRLQGRE